jgi:iron complex outermembrane receptor protein
MALRFSLTCPGARTRPHRLALAAGLALLAVGTQAQEAVQTITVSGHNANNAASVAGFGDIPLARSPYSATVVSTRQLADAGIASLGDITRLDAGITDAYNAPGYWGQLAVRGYTLDNRFNYRRDGLPINAETVVPTGNKAALEVLKGTSGLQAGTSAPGGLVNLVVKRPVASLRHATLEWTQPGSVGAAVDLGDRSTSGNFGWRVNAGLDHLQPLTRNSTGHRSLAALALDGQLAPGTLVEAEVEASTQSQPSTPGFSLLGNRLPSASAIDPRLNLNNQGWSLPVVFSARTASLRLTQALDAQTNLVAHVMRQSLRTDDRIAFPFGCSNEDNYSHYCSDGSFDLYDFRSEGERRTSDAGDLSIQGRLQAGGLDHRYSLGILATRFQSRFNLQAYNWVGVGTLDGRTTVPADPTLSDQNTNRDERSTELHLQDAISLSPQWQLWTGLRHTQLHHASVRTDGSRATTYNQALNTPWLALAFNVDATTLAYASWGQGIESDVAPNRPSLYSNAGQALPALKSRQLEAGLKQRSSTLDWTLTVFDINRPTANDVGGAHVIDGSAHHQGLEAEGEWRSGALSLRGSATVLKARREGSADNTLNGLRPTNVPALAIKLQAAYNLAAVPGLALLGFVSHEGNRMVLPDNSIATPGWTRLDLAARYTQRVAGHVVLWRLAMDNALNQRAWKEAPYQYEHAYLYPLAPRTLSASVQTTF